MKKKTILCALLLLFAAHDMSYAKVRKTARKTQQTTTIAQEKYEEIDNFDFLYSGSKDDLNLEYDAIAIFRRRGKRQGAASYADGHSLSEVSCF